MTLDPSFRLSQNLLRFFVQIWPLEGLEVVVAFKIANYMLMMHLVANAMKEIKKNIANILFCTVFEILSVWNLKMNTLDSFLNFIQRLTHVNVQFNEYFHLTPNFPRVYKVLTTLFMFFTGQWRNLQ